MSNRKLVLLPFALAVLLAVLPFMPQPRPLPPGVTGCIGCNEPVWMAEPVHMLVGLPMLVLMGIILVKLCIVLVSGKLPNNAIFRVVSPLLWAVFFLGAAWYLGWAAREIKLIAYDFTSLIPYGIFAVVDFVFAARLRKERIANQPPRPRSLSPWFEIPE